MLKWDDRMCRFSLPEQEMKELHEKPETAGCLKRLQQFAVVPLRRQQRAGFFFFFLHSSVAAFFYLLLFFPLKFHNVKYSKCLRDCLKRRFRFIRTDDRT